MIFIGQSAWFSPKNHDLVLLDPNLKYPGIDDITKEMGINDLIKKMAELESEMLIYEQTKIKSKINLRNLRGWETATKDKKYIVDKWAQFEVSELQYDRIRTGIVSEVIVMGVIGIPAYIGNYIGRTLSNKFRDATIFNWEHQKKDLVRRKKEEWARFKKEIENEKQAIERSKYFSKTITLFNVINSVRAAWNIFDSLNTENVKNETLPEWSYIYEILILLYASYSLLSFIYQQWEDRKDNNAFENQKTSIIQATKIINDNEWRFYKRPIGHTSFLFLPIKNYGMIPSARVEEIVASSLEQHGFNVKHDDGDEYGEIAIQLNKKADTTNLKNEIEQALNIEKESEDIYWQLEQLSIATRLNGRIGSITQEKDVTFGKITFNFLRDNDALQWQQFFAKHYPESEIIKNQNHQLIIKIPLSENVKFNEIISAARKEVDNRERNSVKKAGEAVSIVDDKGKERMDEAPRLASTEVEKQNKLAAMQKIAAKQDKLEQYKKIVQDKNINADNKTTTDADNQKISIKEIDPDNRSDMFKIPNTVNQYVKFSDKLAHLFFTKQDFIKFRNKAIRNVTMVKNSINDPKETIKDYKTKQQFSPISKLWVAGSDIRVWNKEKRKKINGKMILIHDAKCVMNSAHVDKKK